MALRKGQKELVEQYRGGCCAVSAIPGGGKTYCLSRWAVEMIAQGLHKPGKILIVTFMNSAANNIRKRINDQLKLQGITTGRHFFVATIHGLCLQIIRENPDLVLADDRFEVADNVTVNELMKESVSEWKAASETRFIRFIDNPSDTRLTELWFEGLCRIAQRAAGGFKSKGINAADTLKIAEKKPAGSIFRCCADIYRIYERKLKARGLLDFNDMLHYALELLRGVPGILKTMRKRYSFVCEDEAQDSNAVQNEILKLISDGNLLRVGDSNQAICGTFTNSDFTLFDDFCRSSGTAVYSITQSGRSSSDIIELANFFVRYVRNSHPVEECRESLAPQFIEPVDDNDEQGNPEPSGYNIRAAVFKSWNNEASGVVKQVRSVQNRHPGKTMAVLVPASWQIKQMTRIMQAAYIPYERIDNTSDERNRTARCIGRVLAIFSSPSDSSKFAAAVGEIMAVENLISSEGNPEAVLKDYLKSCTARDIFYLVSEEGKTVDIPDVLIKSGIWDIFLKKIEIMKRILEHPSSVIEKLILYIAEKLEFSSEEMAVACKIANDARHIMGRTGIYSLDELVEELLAQRNVFSHFSGMIHEMSGYMPKPGVVTVCTYHKAKGMEWDAVFLTGLNNADFPARLSDRFAGEYHFLKQDFRNPEAVFINELKQAAGESHGRNPLLVSKLDNISERARLLYVGITRAREYLFMSGSASGRKTGNVSLYLKVLKEYIDSRIHGGNYG